MIDFGDRYFTCDDCDIYCLAKNKGLQSGFPCAKIGNKLSDCGYCEDAFEEKPLRPKNGKRKTGRAYRRYQTAKKRKDLMNILNNDYCYNPYRGYVDWDWVDGEWQPVGKYVKYPKNSNPCVYYKNQSNRKVRRYNGEIHNGNSYRKLYEYWWTLF